MKKELALHSARDLTEPLIADSDFLPVGKGKVGAAVTPPTDARLSCLRQHSGREFECSISSRPYLKVAPCSRPSRRLRAGPGANSTSLQFREIVSL
jgi:hypothetical protein